MTRANGKTAISSYVALGDSFTEGLNDPCQDQPGYRGWADRLAETLGARTPGMRYANLAVRGKLLRQVADEQVPAAIAMAPDLVSLAAGGNDLLRFRDPDLLAESFDELVQALVLAGSQVLVVTGFDPRFPVLRLVRGRVAAFNMHLHAIAVRHHCLVMDLWVMPWLRDPRAWSPDRLHLTADSHRRVALLACEVLGVPAAEDWRDPFPPGVQGAAGRRAWAAARRSDLRWAQVYAAPWLARQVRGMPPAHHQAPKRPELAPVHSSAAAGVSH